MPNFEKAFLEIRRYLSRWTTEVELANAGGYFNINKISEGTALMLLNLVFDLELEDLNHQQNNYPGIDLGDKKKGKLAFQVTSQTDNRKLLTSLGTFVSENYQETYPNGMRFFIIGNRTKTRRNSEKFSVYRDIFNIREDIYYLDDLLELIEQLYYQDEDRFNKIENLLKREFASPKPDPQTRSVVEFNSPLEKFTFYKRILTGIYRDTTLKFVQFDCRLDDIEVSTGDLSKILLENEGMVILGPSGCGKSVLSQTLAIRFLYHGIAVNLEAKYYETDLHALLEKSIIPLGFDSVQDLFYVSSKLDKQLLIIADGINECEPARRPKLLLELEKLKAEHQVKLVISAQHPDPLTEPLNLVQIEVGYPSFRTKKAIAGKYGGKIGSDKIDSLLEAVSNSMEAKMVGEIAVEDIAKVSRFNLAEAFLRQKLGEEKADGFLLLSHIAKILSDDISFSLAERVVEDIIRTNGIRSQAYEKCITSSILEQKLGKISFSHEMFYNFFTVESIIRFSSDVETILSHLNAPKNHDKRLLIIGSITDHAALEQVLEGISDVSLLDELCEGEGGEYASVWAEQKVAETMAMIGEEIDQLEYEISDDTIQRIRFVDHSIMEWTAQQNAFIHVIPYRLVRGSGVLEFASLIEKMDERMIEGSKALKEECQKQKISAFGGAFASTYQSHSQKTAAVSTIISSLNSGFMLFDDYPRVSKETAEAMTSNGSMKFGKFYFVITLLRWRDELQHFYPYALDIIKNKWRSTPSPLLFGVLDNIYFFHRNEEEKQELIDGLKEILDQTNNAWVSTSILDALSQLGELENDATKYVPVVQTEIDRLMGAPDSDENCKAINGLYNCQFDHPYASAYAVAILNLDPEGKGLFYEMALKGLDHFFFGTTLLFNAYDVLKEKMCPLIERFTESPVSESTMPQDAFQVFLLSHIILGKLNYPLVSRFASTDDPIEKSLHAAAELYYWNNRKDLDDKQIKLHSLGASLVLFDQSNVYTIDTLNEFRHNLGQIQMRQLFKDDRIVYIEEQYRPQVVQKATQALRSLDSQKPIQKISFRDDPNLHAIQLLKNHGDSTVIELLKSLSAHPKYGRDAVNAIKALSTTNK